MTSMTPNAATAPFTASPERLAAALPEFTALLHATHEAMTPGPDGAPVMVPLAVNSDAYLSAEAAGLVSFVALRDASGTMVGAAASLVQPHLHTAIPTAITDTLHLTAEAREHGGAGVLLDAVGADVSQRGAVRWLVGERFDAPQPVNLAERGFLPVGAYHAAWIGGAPC